MIYIQTFDAITEKKYTSIKLQDDKKGKKLLKELSEIDHLRKRLNKEYEDKLSQIHKYEDELVGKTKKIPIVTGD